MWKRVLRDFEFFGIIMTWGTSSFGRALLWHRRGEEFESPVLHQVWKCWNVFRVCGGCFVTVDAA